MKSNTIRIKNELPELLAAVCNHPDCKNWLKDAIFDAVLAQPQGVVYTALHFRAAFENIVDEPDQYHVDQQASRLEVVQ